MRAFGALAAVWLCLAAACSGAEPGVERKTAVEHGALLFVDSVRYGTYGNDFSCADCHAADAPTERALSGAPMRGVVTRPSYWGGAERDLLRAINHCRMEFMAAPEPWSATDVEAEAMYAYLASLVGDSRDSRPTPFTVPALLQALPCEAFDRARGAELYAAACRHCHGAADSGEGRRNVRVPILPGDVLAEHAAHPPHEAREAFVSKVRHGRYFDEGGAMPPFALEVLDDESLTALLGFLGLGAAKYCP